MASLRDAMKRLQFIYEQCSPEMVEQKAQEENWDDFTRIKKKLHQEALKEREELFAGRKASSESAEASYRIRLMIKALKETAAELKEILDKDSRKNKLPAEELSRRREILDLCYKHIEEVEQLEKRRFNDKVTTDRVLLLSPTNEGGPEVKWKGGNAGAGGEGGAGGMAGSDPYLSSELPDIDVDNDLKLLQVKNTEIDKQLEQISVGVGKLKEIALDMNQELDRQKEGLEDLDKDVEKALDHLDNVNIKMKQVLEKVMKGDKFLLNCILFCIILGLASYVVSELV